MNEWVGGWVGGYECTGISTYAAKHQKKEGGGEDARALESKTERAREIDQAKGKTKTKKRNGTEDHLGHTLFAVRPAGLDGLGCLQNSDE